VKGKAASSYGDFLVGAHREARIARGLGTTPAKLFGNGAVVTIGTRSSIPCELGQRTAAQPPTENWGRSFGGSERAQRDGSRSPLIGWYAAPLNGGGRASPRSRQV
jgi:hypothetical protein